MVAQSLKLVHKCRTLMEKVTERVGNWLSLQRTNMSKYTPYTSTCTYVHENLTL